MRSRIKKYGLDACLIPFIVWVVIAPAQAPVIVLLQICVMGAVLYRCYLAWRDWNYAPRKLNDIWYEEGRIRASDTIKKVARLYGLEKAGVECPFSGSLGASLYHARQDLITWCGGDPEMLAIDQIAHTVHGFWVPIDRSGTLPSPGLKMKVLDPIPEINGFSQGFDDICLARAQEILAEDKDIAVFWSGGIDSTAALVALLQVANPDDRSRLHIYFRPRSIDEYREFYEDQVRHLPHTIIPGENADAFDAGPGKTFSSDVGRVMADAARDRLIVTGEHGDQVFGSIKIAENPDWIGQPISKFLAEPTFSAHLDEITAFNEAAPVPLQTIDEMLWWWNFAVKWQEITFRSLSDLETAMAFSHVRHFFQTDDFQRWSMANPDLKIKDTLESYKWPAKQFIYNFAGHADYRDHKIKIGSLRVRIGSVLAIDDRYNIIKAGQTSTDAQKIAQRYGDKLHRFAQKM